MYCASLVGNNRGKWFVAKVRKRHDLAGMALTADSFGTWMTGTKRKICGEGIYPRWAAQRP
jgi:hypothetical protein